eukprot:TRINITY_DN1190_c1_g1_i1.p1 TRINITY_DN1190_c1_g1~~TRINITY_DN1190_c1_g1_i1.p1  ORF type:complete len:192 (-),score=42.93 TRINITY_DN1190_c1_g1_i1:462-1037(-)
MSTEKKVESISSASKKLTLVLPERDNKDEVCVVAKEGDKKEDTSASKISHNPLILSSSSSSSSSSQSQASKKPDLMEIEVKEGADGLPEIQSWDHLKGVLAKHAKVMVYFSSAWCNPCAKVVPVIKKLRSDFSSLYIVKVDVDRLTDAVQLFDVKSVPTFQFFAHNERLEDLTLSSSKEEEVVKRVKQFIQ